MDIEQRNEDILTYHKERRNQEIEKIEINTGTVNK